MARGAWLHLCEHCRRYVDGLIRGRRGRLGDVSGVVPEASPIFGIVSLGLITSLVWLTHPEFLDWLTWNKTPDNIETATGRLPVWRWVLEEKLPESPLLGFGFGVGESLARLYNDQQSGRRMIHMHNTLVSGLANLGLVGGCLVSLFWVATGVAAWRAGPPSAEPAPPQPPSSPARSTASLFPCRWTRSLTWIAQAYLAAAMASPVSSGGAPH